MYNNESRIGYILIDAYRAEAAMMRAHGNEGAALKLDKAANKMEFLTKLHK